MRKNLLPLLMACLLVQPAVLMIWHAPPASAVRPGGVLDIHGIMTPQQIAESRTPAGTDGQPIWDLMLQTLEANGSNRVVWPGGKFTFAETIVLDRQLDLSGSVGATIFQFPPHVSGMVITKYLTRIEGLALVGGGGSGSAFGILAEQRFYLENCSCSKFSGNGFQIIADGAQNTNANFWSIKNLTVKRNGKHGLFVQGNNCNAGHGEMIDASVNGGRGIWDASLLGNTYEACHTSTNGRVLGQVSYEGRYYQAGEAIDSTTPPDPSMTKWDDVWRYTGFDGPPKAGWPAWELGGTYLYSPGYFTNSSTARNVFVGCYNEGQSSPCSFTEKTNVVGGNLASSVINATNWQGNTFYNGIKTETPLDSGYVIRDEVEITLPHSTHPAFLRCFHTHEDGSKEEFIFLMNESGYLPGNYLMQAVGSRVVSMGIIGKKGFEDGAYGRTKAELPLGSPFFLGGMFVGSVEDGCRVTAGPAQPTWSGTWGDFHRNTRPVAGGPSGWVCLEDGTWDEQGSSSQAELNN